MLKVDTSKTVSALDAIINKLDNFHDNVLKDITKLGRQVAQQKSKGSLSKSIKVEDKDSNQKQLLAPKPYATYVENGRPGIRTQGKGVLRFVINGQVFYRKSVGPAKPRPFMKPAGLSMKEHAAKIIQNNWNKIL